MKKENFYNLFYIFIFGSVFGWVFEVVYTLIKKGILINHSALVIGPFNFAYGICAVVFTLLLVRFKDWPFWKLFIISFIGGSILEYIMSWGMELVIGFSAWDYSEKFLNINGRIAFFYSVAWGILGAVWIKKIYPWVTEFISKMNFKILKKVMIFLLIFLIFDGILTMSAISRAKDEQKGIVAHNNYERFLDKTFNQKYLKNMFNNSWK